MINFKLANVLVEINERFRNFRTIYVQSSSPIVEGDAPGETVLAPHAEYNFSTYFNALSIGKWREYTVIDNAWLHLEIKGVAELAVFSVKKRSVGVVKRGVEFIKIDSPDSFETIDYELPNDQDAVLFAFSITTSAPTTIRNGYYYTKVDEASIRKVHLALATTTFKKEDYIAANVDLFKNDIQACGDPVSGNVSFVISDNGRTLEKEMLEGDGVYVFPNKNVGGAGGFARGMIEAGRLEPRPTHVLIMDDDIELSSESIKRTFNLLSLVNKKYSRAFVSGAMFSLGNQQMQIEDVGCAMSTGKFGPIKRGKNMEVLYDVVTNEDPLPRRTNRYAAFWYCCIPMATIDEKGLPLPIFIRYDDAEYGMRCKPEFMTMNGINVWHLDFIDRYSPFYERYCGMRNSLVIQATSGVCPNIDFMDVLFSENFKREMKKFDYGSAELLLDAVEDYLRGPEWLAVDRCEELLRTESAKVDKLKPLDELDVDNISLENLDKKTARPEKTRFIDALTFNGQRFVPGFLRKNKLVPARYNPNDYEGRRMHFQKHVLEVDRLDEKGVIRKADDKRARALIRRYNHIRRLYTLNHERVEAEYAAAKDWLTSEEFWKGYLEID